MSAPLKYFSTPSPPVIPGMVADPWGGSKLRPVIDEHAVE